MPLILPTLEGVGDQRYRITLAGVEYRVRLYYSARFESYYLDLADAEGVAIQSGVRVVIGFPLLIYNRRSNLPAGQFIASRFDVEQDRAAFGTLGADMLLTFYTNAELERPSVSAAPTLTITPL